VAEGGSAQFTVRLSAQPTGNLTVSITKQSGGDADLAATPASLTFTPDNWNTAQAVTVTAAQDADTANGTASFLASATGLASQAVSVTEADNDVHDSEGSISGWVCLDSNNNAWHESNEIYVAYVKVTLAGTDSLGQKVSLEQITGIDGRFQFCNLRDGTYTLSEQQPASDSDGSDWREINGKAEISAANDTFSNIVLTANETRDGYYFGELGFSSRFLSKRLLLPTAPLVGSLPWQRIVDRLILRAEEEAGHSDLVALIRTAASSLETGSLAISSPYIDETSSGDQDDEGLLAAMAAESGTTVSPKKKAMDAAIEETEAWVPLLTE
jgi:hypothetical protein